VRNKNKTIYCYSEPEKMNALLKIGKSAEITRFKGLGEISPNEFKHFIGSEMRLDPVILAKEDRIQDLLAYFMGKNTKDRQDFIIENLRIEEDILNA
jgi:topoisomerase-4 subunit B